jgi:nitrogen fixation NifU-like protein
MSSDFEKTVNELQESIMEDARKIYSEKVIELWLNPRNRGKVPKADGFAKIKGPCGDTMQISFKVKDGRLSKIASSSSKEEKQMYQVVVSKTAN